IPNPDARDVVHVAGADGNDASVAFSGMRVTFPQWSPVEEQLSLWVTFTPSHRALIAGLLRWGLPPGDPAAIFDPTTRRISWMTVNPQEKVQVGHYHLLKRDYAEAWRWYAEAEREAPPAEMNVEQFQEAQRNGTGP